MSEFLADRRSALCARGPRPILVTGYLRMWLAGHFSSAGNIEHKELRSLLWTEVDSSKLMIESVTTWKPQASGKRPAVVIRRNDWTNMRKGIDDRNMGGYGTPPVPGATHYATHVQGSHTLFCLSTRPMEAEILGAEVFREMVEFGPVVRRELDLHRFVAVGGGTLMRVKESMDHYAVPVTVGYIAEEAWYVAQQAPPMNELTLSMMLP